MPKAFVHNNVKEWNTTTVVAWIRDNTSLPEEDIQLVQTNNITGHDVFNTALFSFDKLREQFPGSPPQLWKIFLQLRLATCIPTSLATETPCTSENLEDLHLIGCQAAIKVAAPHIEAHEHDSSKPKRHGPLSKGTNARLFATGAPGIRKRFGCKFPQLLKAHVSQPVKVKLEKVHTVCITFKSDMAIQPKVDLKWRTPLEQVNWILTSRAIFNTYIIDEQYSTWASHLATLIGDELPEDFNMETFTKELIAIAKPKTLYYHVDEVQALLQVPNIGADVIHQMSYLYARFNGPNLFTLLLYTGTHLSDVKKMVRPMSIRQSADLPIIILPDLN